MKIFRTPAGIVSLLDGQYRHLDGVHLDELFSDPDAISFWRHMATSAPGVPAPERLLPPIGSQEVWAAGVTYFRSKQARMEEAKEAHGSDFYDRVYVADRPELFLKATPGRVVGPGAAVRVRSDSTWTVPEPELVLAIDSGGSIIGYTIGNDVSARDIEGENPLYLPQAKCYRDSCALGPCLLLSEEPLEGDTGISLQVRRGEHIVFSGETHLREMKRTWTDLVTYLYRDNVFPAGCFLFTGTGIVPPDDFTLEAGDHVRIEIDPIGALENGVDRD